MVRFFNTYFELLQFIEIIYVTNKCKKCIEVDGGIFQHLLWTVAIYWDNLRN